MYEAHFIGAKHTGEYRRAADIAKDIRADIKAAVKAGDLPGEIDGAKITYRVTCHNYSGGRSIDVAVEGAPDSWLLRLLEAGDPYWNDGANAGERVFTDAAKALRKAVDEIRLAYGYDASNSMIDYFNVDYYGSTNLRSESETAWHAANRKR